MVAASDLRSLCQSAVAESHWSWPPALIWLEWLSPLIDFKLSTPQSRRVLAVGRSLDEMAIESWS
jgi:hypothetical protein